VQFYGQGYLSLCPKPRVCLDSLSFFLYIYLFFQRLQSFIIVMAQPQSTPQVHRGIIKMVLSGDMVVIRGQPRGGPPPERTLALSYITAPKLGRMGRGGGGEGASAETSTSDTKDEPFAWHSREFLRKLLIGKEVQFAIDHKTSSGREYGIIWTNKDGEKVNVAELMVIEGLVEVRQSNVRPSEELTKLIQLESDAKVNGKGKWTKAHSNDAVRKVNWSVDNVRQYADKYHGKQLEAVIEHVRDACTVRAIVIPSFDVLTVAMTGIKSPSFKRDGDKEVPEPFAEQAKFFTDSRLLQRDVKLLIEGVSSQNIVLATIIHPAGNIAELLLQEGFAWCVDWSMSMVTKDRDKLRAAEKQAKANKLRYWKDYQPKPQVTSSSASLPSNNFSGKVVEVVNSDAVVLKTDKGQYQKVFFSSFRPPRKTEDSSEQQQGSKSERPRPLYDVPFMFEAREFLRKKLIGKRVSVAVDYVKPAQDQFPERICCTVTREGVNIAEALVSKGLGTCVKHGRNDDQRSSHYDDLLSAENRAIKNKKGVHGKKETSMHRVADISGDPSKARQFLPFLQRAGRTTALVEFVASGSRMKLYLPKDTCLINFILAGVSCPRAGTNSDKQRQQQPAEPYGQEAMNFTKELILQREVDVEVENCDKGGNFIGWMFVDGRNLAVSLVEEGYCKVLGQAERSQYSRQLYGAEETARAGRKRTWEGYTEPVVKEEDEEEEEGLEVEPAGGDSKATDNNGGNKVQPADRKVDYRKVIVTEIESGTHFWAQDVDKGPQFETMMKQLRSDFEATPPLAGSFNPRKGSLCAAKFTDGLWYRGLIEKVVSPKEVQVLFVDFGNRLSVSSDKLALLPPNYTSQPSLAKEYHLACIQLHSDDEWAQEAMSVFQNEVDQTTLLNVEYKLQGMDYVTLKSAQSDQDIGEKLVEDGLASVTRRKDRKLQSLITRYIEAEDRARKSHVNIWRYGDFREDNAIEFGYKRQ
uniref:Staphylococcal nuclease domain-containing protein 1 n=2 Tax=Amphimedon queenslandica TaxID=400682 RepID=A0A1X7UNN1_AMPQE